MVPGYLQKMKHLLVNIWNAVDGQDGGNDYYRGTCYYTKKLALANCQGAEQVYIEFEGANSSADVYVNGKLAVHHDGGYSTFRANITDLLTEESEIVVTVDNSPNDYVYPQMADFTFYGGIYRDVNIICVPKAHFDLDFWGGPDLTGATRRIPSMLTKSGYPMNHSYTFVASATLTV